MAAAAKAMAGTKEEKDTAARVEKALAAKAKARAAKAGSTSSI